jgi:uncharacterized membrane protein SpoIIM required for sporulation
VVDYLESLCERAYYLLYGVRGRIGERFARFLAYDLPAAVKSIWRETLVSAFLMILATVVAFLLVRADPDWFYAFSGGGGGDARNPAASAEELRRIIYGQDKDQVRDGLSTFASFLFTHNAQIALGCFATGFAFGAPTAFLILSNGAMLGAFLAIHVDKGLGYEIGGWLSIHGVTELSAVVLAGAAGFHIGSRIGFPGDRPRLEAARRAGRTGAVVMGGVVIMLMFAGLLEGFGRQLVTDDLARYGIGWAFGIFWAAYYYLPRKNRYGR